MSFLACIHCNENEEYTLNQVVVVSVKTLITKAGIDSDYPRALENFLGKLQNKKQIKVLKCNDESKLRIKFLVELFPKIEKGNFTPIYRNLFNFNLKPQLGLLCMAMLRHEYKYNGDELDFKVSYPQLGKVIGTTKGSDIKKYTDECFKLGLINKKSGQSKRNSNEFEILFNSETLKDKRIITGNKKEQDERK